MLVLVYVLMAFVHPKGNRRNLLNHRCASQGMTVRPASSSARDMEMTNRADPTEEDRWLVTLEEVNLLDTSKS